MRRKPAATPKLIRETTGKISKTKTTGGPPPASSSSSSPPGVPILSSLTVYIIVEQTTSNQQQQDNQSIVEPIILSSPSRAETKTISPGVDGSFTTPVTSKTT